MHSTILVRSILIAVTLFLCQQIHAQDSVIVFQRSGTPDPELKDIMSFQGIEEFKLDLIGPNLKGKAIMLSFEEYKEGKITSKAVLTKGLPDIFFQAKSDTFHLKVLCQSKGDSTQINYYFPRFNISNFYRTERTSVAYSMRYVLPTDGNDRSLMPANKERQALFTYSLPYEKPDEPGHQYYCELTRNGVPPEKWWEVYHVKHFVIFYIQIG